MVKKSEKDGSVVIISGPSGVGKSTICRQIAQRGNVFVSVSVTTRPKAESEVDGGDYWFISKERFQEKIEKDEFLEYAEVFENFYGTPRDDVEKALEEGKTVLLEIDVQGALSVKKVYLDALMIFILPPTQGDLAGRMAHRARGEDDKTASKRLDSAGTEIAAAWQYYGHMVINADIGQAVEEIIQIIETNSGEKQ